ncbi:MAG: tRNA uridine-5-carboxymethylaminomethyl(34) synthesis enzyme MnmG [Candidatus Omnitrophica bacterium]|nr:tRNA uridine-5-carboxymethylaminomethyl(34) synthesis enzyme MnmG [Candidatus Omnitrophota bacterium]MBU1925344.1 tRNA uridine-5-carboxymethylaminomethyl(34) synthesis enzyme MnmG [Candidatus Omnitrophota bacterium]
MPKSTKFPEQYDIIVVGAGHAGCEAALAASRMGQKTLLATINLDSIAQLSCNPAIGGPGKGHLAREIDALGGEMAKIVDKAGIQFRMLNTKKGPAVWAPRAQIDKSAYQNLMRQALDQQPRLSVKQLLVTDLIIHKNKAVGIVTSISLKIYAKAVILTTGTFLNGLIHIGETTCSAGRAGEAASLELPRALARCGLETGRLKTGTSARIHKDSINYKCFIPQKGDNPPQPFSYANIALPTQQECCYLGHTNTKTHQIIKNNLHRSPLYSGKIKGIGVRYCPSIEDKVVKFPHKNRHQIFLEPEGKNSCEIYLNGVSTSLPADVQIKLLHSIEGLERAEIMRFGYGIEYDFIDPTQLKPTLETKSINNLYCAGQINGTTGYEEAAVQGLLAGINASLQLGNKASFVLDRTQGYAGVLVDDLVTKGTREPYRLFTSRVEHRLILRQDNADLRLSGFGYKFGLIEKEKIDKIEKTKQSIAECISLMHKLQEGNSSLAKILKRPGMTYDKIRASGAKLPQLDSAIKTQVEIEIKYEGYIQREKALVQKLKKWEEKILPADFPFQKIRGLKKEAQEKLSVIKPRSVGQAMRISGVTSNDVALVLLALGKREDVAVCRR